jgi:predicted nucleic acid-binding protein
LDTNIVSQSIKPYPDEKVTRWLSSLPQADAFISVVSILEVRTGIELMPAGRKRIDLESWLVATIRKGYAGRILPITEEIADRCGILITRGKKQGALPEQNDALLAATALVHGLKVATLNRKDFARLDVELVDF